ncbi:HEAT repeat domain-containing protein [Mycobacterium sp. E1715]|uniref:HEAT repeat domain-containing protein n=1 Tax=Mycobacterium sp. E1715 TaxID=1856863 RepID=UPI0018D3510C|nr:HEAT repeat domain-containing protein [Mycobacterium sp. E1715]
MSVTSMQSEPGAERPRFDYDLVVCPSFDAVLRDGAGERTSPNDLISKAFEAGRVLIQAKGGSGKTWTLSRLAAAAAESGVDVSRLDVLGWANAFEGGQLEYTAPRAVLASATPHVSEAALGESRRQLLLIDGLNEISPPIGAALLDEVDRLASQFPSLAIIVTDRLNRRRIVEKLWVLATLSPVSMEQRLELLPDAGTDPESPLGLPYYLNLAIGGDRGSRSQQQRTFLLKHGGVEPEWLDGLAAAAYSQYEQNGDRRVDVDQLIARVGEPAVDSLVSAGTLVLEPTCRFSHHLLHDYLAATYAATRPDLWNDKGLDVLTFKATSFDALAMILEQAPDNADLLVRCVYDWNFYGAAYLIAEDRQAGSHVSPAMEFAVVTMLGERRFDRFARTAQAVADALEVIDTAIARDITMAQSRTEIIDYVRLNGNRFAGQEWLNDWITLYTRPESEQSTLQDIAILASDDSILGWTMSNVVRRSPLAEDVERELVRLASTAKSDVVRWRAVHALGITPTREAIAALFNSLDADKSTWVRYGSIRSLAEIALTSEELRDSILTDLARRVPVLRTTPLLIRELEHVLLPMDAPSGWADDSAVVVEELWAKSASVEEQDRWRKLGASIRSLSTEARL